MTCFFHVNSLNLPSYSFVILTQLLSCEKMDFWRNALFSESFLNTEAVGIFYLWCLVLIPINITFDSWMVFAFVVIIQSINSVVMLSTYMIVLLRASDFTACLVCLDHWIIFDFNKFQWSDITQIGFMVQMRTLDWNSFINNLTEIQWMHNYNEWSLFDMYARR